jgi:hypothetical protein
MVANISNDLTLCVCMLCDTLSTGGRPVIHTRTITHEPSMLALTVPSLPVPFKHKYLMCKHASIFLTAACLHMRYYAHLCICSRHTQLNVNTLCATTGLMPTGARLCARCIACLHICVGRAHLNVKYLMCKHASIAHRRALEEIVRNSGIDAKADARSHVC